MTFPCTKCGCCCKRVSAFSGCHARFFPCDVDEDGHCEFLTKENLCDIYEDRPLICNIDKCITASEEDVDFMYKETADLCNKWMDEDGVPEEFRVILKKEGE